MKTRHLLIIVSFLIVSNYSYAQEFQIRGKVISDDTFALPGAIVENLISKEKVATDLDGDYVINAKIGDTLKFSPEKLENCFEVVYRTVSNDSNINVQILSKAGLKNQLCKDIPKEFYIFIGKRISSESDYSYDECFINMNTNIVADFEIVEQFYGDLNMKSITFKDSDHASIIPFPYLNTRYSLLLIVKYCDEYYLRDSKEIYKTKNGQWAVAYNPKNYSTIKDDTLHLQTINFKSSAKVLPKGYNRKRDSLLLKKPYYENKGIYFKPLMGNYVKDYVALWLENTNELKNLNVKED